jgi:hypothetical protein
LEKGGEGGFEKRNNYKISPDPSLPKRGLPWGLTYLLFPSGKGKTYLLMLGRGHSLSLLFPPHYSL